MPEPAILQEGIINCRYVIRTIVFKNDALQVPAETDGAFLETKTTFEANGLIYVWHHAEAASPHWHPPVLDEIGADWVYQGRNEYEVRIIVIIGQCDHCGKTFLVSGRLPHPGHP